MVLLKFLHLFSRENGTIFPRRSSNSPSLVNIDILTPSHSHLLSWGFWIWRDHFCSVGQIQLLVHVRILHQIRNFFRSVLCRNCALKQFRYSEGPQNKFNLGGHKTNQICSWYIQWKVGSDENLMGNTEQILECIYFFFIFSIFCSFFFWIVLYHLVRKIGKL